MNLLNNESWRTLRVVLLLIIFSSLTVNRLAPELLNADTILFPIMSLQHVTLFIWGQDRLANFIPYLFSVISTPELNLFAHLWLFSLSFFILIFLCSQIIKEMAGDKEGGVAAFVITIVVCFITLGPVAAYAFMLEGQPYAASYLLLISSFLIFMRPMFNAQLNSTLIVVALFVATGLNPSILVPAAGLSAGWALVRKDWRRGLFFVFIAMAMFVLWLQLSKWYGTPTGTNAYSAFSLQNIQENIILAVFSILSQVRLVYVSALICSIIVIGVVANVDVSRTSRKILGLIWIFAIAWLIVFSSNDWVKLNNSHFRYFFPIFLVFIFTLSYILYVYFRKLNFLHRNWLVAACLVAVVSELATPLVLFPEYAIFKKNRAATQFAEKENVQFVAGDYWTAWPMVFQMQKIHGSAFGLLYRGDGNARNAVQALNSELKIRAAVKVICMNAAIDVCINDIANFTQRNWHVTNVDCGRGCKLLEIKQAAVVNLEDQK